MTMREKMARAMFATSDTSAIGHTWESISEQHRLDYLEEVDAVLDVLLTGLTQKEADEIQDGGPYFGEINGHDLFKGFIRAIKEGK